jgi:hypothetical protein
MTDTKHLVSSAGGEIQWLTANEAARYLPRTYAGWQSANHLPTSTTPTKKTNTNPRTCTAEKNQFSEGTHK